MRGEVSVFGIVTRSGGRSGVRGPDVAVWILFDERESDPDMEGRCGSWTSRPACIPIRRMAASTADARHLRKHGEMNGWNSVGDQQCMFF